MDKQEKAKPIYIEALVMTDEAGSGSRLFGYELLKLADKIISESRENILVIFKNDIGKMSDFCSYIKSFAADEADYLWLKEGFGIKKGGVLDDQFNNYDKNSLYSTDWETFGEANLERLERSYNVKSYYQDDLAGLFYRIIGDLWKTRSGFISDEPARKYLLELMEKIKFAPQKVYASRGDLEWNEQRPLRNYPRIEDRLAFMEMLMDDGLNADDYKDSLQKQGLERGFCEKLLADKFIWRREFEAAEKICKWGKGNYGNACLRSYQDGHIEAAKNYLLEVIKMENGSGEPIRNTVNYYYNENNIDCLFIGKYRRWFPEIIKSFNISWITAFLKYAAYKGDSRTAKELIDEVTVPNVEGPAFMRQAVQFLLYKKFAIYFFGQGNGVIDLDFVSRVKQLQHVINTDAENGAERAERSSKDELVHCYKELQRHVDLLSSSLDLLIGKRLKLQAENEIREQEMVLKKIIEAARGNPELAKLLSDGKRRC